MARIRVRDMQAGPARWEALKQVSFRSNPEKLLCSVSVRCKDCDEELMGASIPKNFFAVSAFAAKIVMRS
jgi:hypothetical protein